MNWDEYYFRLCLLAAEKSKDPSTKVGCVIVGPDKEVRATGFNGFPRGVIDDPARYADRLLKYKLVAHAELNAVCHAARIGTSIKGCTVYTSWLPCSNCSIALIQAGITRVFYLEPPEDYETGSTWEEEFEFSKMMFTEAGVLFAGRLRKHVEG